MRIVELAAYPVTARITDRQGTSQADWSEVSMVMVRLKTDTGLVGWGEGLARKSPAAYATLIRELLAPIVIGSNPFAVEASWATMMRVFTGRSGGMLVEAVAAVDIAIWDLIGKALGRPLYEVFGHMGRETVAAYASSIGWNDDETARAQTRQCLDWGFREIKVKIGAPWEAAIARAKLVREIAGPDIRLSADSNWIYSVDEAVAVARALGDLDYTWFEEPIVPEDLDGYGIIARKSPVRIAAGESEHTAVGAAALIQSRAIGVFQPDVARSGGITETRRMIALASAFHVAYAPHVGFSGAVCAAASLHLAAAAPNCETYECMIFGNPLRDDITRSPVAARDGLIDGRLPVPTGPGLGIEIDEAALAKLVVA
jgi:galactonate dehydratase